MSMFSSSNIEGIDEEFINEDGLVEALIVDEVLKMDEQEIRDWCETPEAKALVEANVLRKPTLMRLSKADDKKRREKLAAYRLAKAHKDPLYNKLLLYRGKWKAVSAKIMQKYGSKASRIAQKSQKTYIKDYAKNVKAGKVKVQKVK